MLIFTSPRRLLRWDMPDNTSQQDSSCFCLGTPDAVREIKGEQRRLLQQAVSAWPCIPDSRQRKAGLGSIGPSKSKKELKHRMCHCHDPLNQRRQHKKPPTTKRRLWLKPSLFAKSNCNQEWNNLPTGSWAWPQVQNSAVLQSDMRHGWL